MKINDITEKYLISRRMIQEYTDLGLVNASSKNKYGHLVYDELSVRKIVTVRYFQELGLSLADIKKMFDSPYGEKMNYLKQQMKQLTGKISKLDIYMSFLKDILQLNEEDDFVNCVFTVISKEMEK